MRLVKLLIRNLIQSYANPNMTQQQANQAYQKQSFQLTNNNAFVAHILFLACFISPFSPFSLIICLISFILQYFLAKIHLIKFCKQPIIICSQFQTQLYQMVFVSPIFIGLGNLCCILIQMQVSQISNIYTKQIVINLATLAVIFLLILLLNAKELIIIQFFIKCIKQQTGTFLHDDKKRQQNSINLGQSQRSNHFKLLLKNQKHQNVQGCILKLRKRARNNYQKSYDEVYGSFKETYQKHFPIPERYLLNLNSKQISISYRQKMQIIEQLNTMSKSLQQSLKDKLFNQQRKGSILTPRITHRTPEVDDNVYFQYQTKVNMQKPNLRVNVPLLYKRRDQGPPTSLSVQYQLYKSRSVNNLQSTSKRQKDLSNFNQEGNCLQLKRINSIFGEEEEQLKQIVKKKLKHSIKKVNQN